MMGMKVKPSALREIIEDIDEDGSGLLEFGEFCQLAAKFLVEEDEEALKKELKEAFRIYDKECNGYISTDTLKEILREPTTSSPRRTSSTSPTRLMRTAPGRWTL